MRYVIEGTWSGFVSNQQHVCHRSVITKKMAERIEKAGLSSISFTDGTSLWLHVRKCLPRERVKENRSYSSLIDDCLFYGVDSVTGLQEKRSA